MLLPNGAGSEALRHVWDRGILPEIFADFL
jgi:hypothetical protein